MGEVLHGELVIAGPNGTGQTVVIQSGTVTQVQGDSVTVRSTDGYTVTWTLNGQTVVRTGWAQGSVKDIVKGDTVRAEGTRSGGSTVARLVAERPKNAPTQRQPSSGRLPRVASPDRAAEAPA
jgi:hypothetical protein